MFDVVLELKGLSIDALIALAKAIRAGIANQTAFSSLAAKLTELDTLIDALEAAQTALAGAKAAVSQKRELRDDAKPPMTDLLSELAIDVGKLAPDVPTIEATTLRVKNAPSTKPIPDKPTGLELTIGDEEAEISGQCDGQPGIVEYYEIRWTTADPNAAGTTWNHGETSKKSYFELQSLPSGQKIWVQIRAVNARGKSPWSDPACVRVP